MIKAGRWVLLIIVATLSVISLIIPASLIGASGIQLDNSIRLLQAAIEDPVVDNSTSSAFPPIGNQRDLPSCVGWATTYYQFTYENARARGLNGASIAFSPKWTYNMINKGAEGESSPEDAYNLLKKNGAATIADFPYDEDFRAWDLNPNDWLKAINYRAATTDTITDSGTDSFLDSIKKTLADEHVLVFKTYVQEWVQKQIDNDPSTKADDSLVNQYIAAYMTQNQKDLHSMTLVGYNDNIWCDLNGNGKVDSAEKGAFKIANSRGTGDWNSGFRWVSYDALRANSKAPDTDHWPTSDRDSRGIFLGKVYALTARSSYTPTMTAEVTLNAPYRDQIAIVLGAGSTGSGNPSKTWRSAAINFSGGPYAFDGTSTPVDGTFYFDFTDIADQAPPSTRWFLGVVNGGNNTPVIKSFKLYKNNELAATCEEVPKSVPTSQDNRPTYVWVDYSSSTPTPTPTPTPTATPTPAQQYTLTITVTGKGKVEPAAGGYVYEKDKAVVLTAIPDAGQTFIRWTGDLSGNTSPATIIMNANKRVTAVFSGSTPSSGGGGGGGGGSSSAEISVTLIGFNDKSSLIINRAGTVQKTTQLKTNDGNMILEIPQGTLLKNSSGSALRTVTLSTVSKLPEAPTGNALIAGYNLGPEGAKFNPPLTLTVHYDPENLSTPYNEENLYLAYWDGKQWVDLESQINTSSKTISTRISHFSQYALMEKILAPAAFIISNLICIPEEVNPGVPTIVQATIANTGETRGVCPVILKVNDTKVDKWDITLSGGQTENITFLTQKETPGIYSIDVNGVKGEFTVLDPASSIIVAATPDQTVTPTPAIASAASEVPRTPESIPASESSIETTTAETQRSIPLKWIITGVVIALVLIGAVVISHRSRTSRKEEEERR